MKKVSGGVAIRKCPRCLAELEGELKRAWIFKSSANHKGTVGRDE
jgi:hypothetical protein